MDKLEPITVRPVPCDTAREECERIFGDYRDASHYRTVDLMILAWRMADQRAYARGYRDGQDATFTLVNALLPAPRDDETFPVERPRPDYAADVDDPVRADRRAIERAVR